MLTGKLWWLPLVFCFFCAMSYAQEAKLVPGQPVEREIAGGQLHTYSVKLSTGQFMRGIAVQKGINIVIALSDPNGNEIWQANFSGNFGGQESLSYEAATPGEYSITIKPFSNTSAKGIYELRLEIKATAAAEDQKRINAERLLMGGLTLLRQSNYPPAIEKALQVLPLWRELGDAYWEADTLSLLGSAHNSTRKFDQAAEYYNQALLLRQQIKDRAGESNALSDLGVVFTDWGKSEQALTYLTRALEIKRDLKDRAGEARALFLTASADFQLGRYPQVTSYTDQALEIYTVVGDKEGIGNSYNLRGRCYYNLRQYDDAAKNFEKAIEIFRELKNRSAESRILHNLGLIKDRAGQYDQSLELYEKSLAIKRELKDRLNEGVTLSSVGSLMIETGEYEKALKYLDDALSIALEFKDRPTEAVTRNGIGSVYALLGQNEKAFESYQAALAIAQSLKNPFIESRSLRNLEKLTYDQGLYEREIEWIEKMLVLDRESKDRQLEANDLILLSGAYRHFGRYDRALEILAQGLALSREIKFPSAEAVALANLGLVHTVQGNYQEAIGFHKQALALLRETKQPQEGRTLINLGECFAKLGRFQEAIESANEALTLMRQTKDRDGEAIALGNLGAAYNASVQYAKATEALSQSLAIARELKSAERLREALNELARLERNQGNLAKASAYLEESLKSLESSRNEIYSPQSRAGFLAAEQENLGLYIDLLMRRNQAEPGKGFDALAVETSERGRARVLLELLGEASINIRQGVDTTLVAKEQDLGKKVNVWAGRLEQATKPELISRLKLELSQFEQDLELTQAEIRKASPQYAALTQPQPLKLKEIQAQLDADTLLLEYTLGKERSYLWAIGRDSLTSYELPKEEQINQNALQVYELLTARSINKRGETGAQRQERISQAEAKLPVIAKELGQTLLGPVASQLGNKRIVIVADGALQYIPFAMLPDPVVNKIQPLIVSHEIVSLPSASALAIQRAEIAGRAAAPKTLAVIADPVFDRSDDRVKTAATNTGDKQQTATVSVAISAEDARSIEHLAPSSDSKSGATTLRLVIPRLPYTRQEANQLMALAPKSSSISAMDFQASRVTVLNGELSQYRYVHFATHGLLDSERPDLSSLVLSMVDADGKPQDGFLRANDIYNLKLPADLVVLSACQTGLGKEIKGEGLVGLTRGFMYAGAARVVVSLWSVNDRATAVLMTKFYEKMLKQGERPAAALRAAQVEMWKQKQWQSPYYWAAFTMQGEWR